MEKRTKIIVFICMGFIIVIGIILSFYFLFKNIMLELGDHVELDTENYLTAIEVEGTANFILLVNKNYKISNIIYLNKKSVESLYHKKIEGKKIEKAIPSIVENLKNSKVFDDDQSIILIDYGNQGIFSKVEEEFNKQFVIYGISKEITTDLNTIQNKLDQLNLEFNNNQEKDLQSLYYHSLDIISKSREDKDFNMDQERKENIDQYALNVYNKLLTYSSSISNQTKDDLNGIDITTINATGDYENEQYATKKSWYYIKDYKVYAYLNFSIHGKSYDYCFLGSNQYTKDVCPS
ncbi:MAG: hypothetical protein HFJ12_04620 [Bacilli bacterium]|nr:hypothetical protein [Bacilli bacterium]